MGGMTVDQILVTPLKRIPLNEGDVLHAMKSNDVGYADFGEAYFSMIKHASIKAWKRHLRMTLNLVVPLGRVRFAFADDIGGIREEFAGDGQYVRLTVPPGIWFGFQGVMAPHSMLLNIADIPHNAQEIERKNLEEIYFNW